MSRPTRLCRAAAVAIAVALWVVAPTTPAAAHVSLVDACPFGGDVVAELDAIELTFGGPLIADSDPAPEITLVGDLGRTDIELGPVELVGDTGLSAEVPGALEPGLYIVRYRVVSADGDNNTGGFEFTLDPQADDAVVCDDLDAAAGSEASSGGGGGTAALALLAVGGVAVVAVVVLLRPRRGGERAEL